MWHELLQLHTFLVSTESNKYYTVDSYIKREREREREREMLQYIKKTLKFYLTDGNGRFCEKAFNVPAKAFNIFPTMFSLFLKSSTGIHVYVFIYMIFVLTLSKTTNLDCPS